MFLIRWLHKWFGLILGLQFLLWAVSGATMALLDHHKVSAEDAILPARQVSAPAAPLPLAAVQARVGAPVLQLQLKPLSDTYVYEVTTPSGVQVLDAVRGTPIPIDAAKAEALAVARYSGGESVRTVTRVDRPTLETRDLALPVWRVEFTDKERTTLLVSAGTGEILGAKNNTWRLWDIAWMLHIMDYDDRQSFNHPLIITLAVGAAWLALSGLILLFRSFRRADVAWIADPLDSFAARRGARAAETPTSSQAVTKDAG